MADGLESYGRAVPVPKMVQDFVVYFYRHISERNIREIYSMYSHTFPHLSERFFKGTQWPPAESISHLVDGDTVFLMLYRELTFRHAHAAGPASPALRAASWRNYVSLFRVVLDARLNARLPNAWLWDIIEEFTYQFQATAQARGRAQGRADADVETDAGTWAASDVLAILNELVDRSNTRAEISTPEGAERLFTTEGYGLGDSNVLRMLGYFSLVGLLKVHVVLGEHEAGLAALAPIVPLARGRLFATKIALACVSLFYHSAFAYAMLRRYLDAARCLSFVLAYVPRVKTALARGPAYDQVLKRNEQLYALAALCVALCPAAAASFDDATSTALRDKHGDKIRAMSGGAVEPFEDLFAYACPKFVLRDVGAPRTDAAAVVAAAAGVDASSSSSAAAPSAPGANANAEAYRAQLADFLSTVERRKHLPALVSLLGLYASIPLTKLATLAELDEPSLREQLGLLQESTHVFTWASGDALSGEPVQAGEVDFTVERRDGADVVVVREARASSAPSAAFLIAHVQKLREIAADLDAISLAPAPQPAAAAAK